ncbi:MAG TPA: hypothetical protein PLK23_09505 [Clostridia bacterium]|nr:MAG: Cell division protein FtsL [Firmicutes bacterium ADurb.Bin099]HHT94531.1 hypothetical protein [Clostridiaceae bacterium]HOF26961.1 hypothetical protein [Clostridia bacterium]HOM35367.1 hypothetical protein [Clostridia bacterium]HOR90350.1 hypothetical protein [Clostridia bacterium]
MEIERNDEKRIFNRFNSVVLLVLVFIALFIIIYRYGEMINLNYDITSLNNQLREKTAVNSAIYADLDRQYNIDDIKNIAETKLDMNKPRADQRILIHPDMSDRYQSSEKEDFYSYGRAVWEKIKHTAENISDIFIGSKKD